MKVKTLLKVFDRGQLSGEIQHHDISTPARFIMLLGSIQDQPEFRVMETQFCENFTSFEIFT